MYKDREFIEAIDQQFMVIYDVFIRRLIGEFIGTATMTNPLHDNKHFMKQLKSRTVHHPL